MADIDQYDTQGRGTELCEMQSASRMVENTSSIHLGDVALREPLQYQVELGAPMLSEHGLDGGGIQ